jgi:hypothetical protein
MYRFAELAIGRVFARPGGSRRKRFGFVAGKDDVERVGATN